MIIQETIPILRKYTLKYLEIKRHDFVTYHLKVQKVCMPVCTYIYMCVYTNWRELLFHCIIPADQKVCNA